MNRIAQGLALGLLLVTTALHAGCGNSASGLTTGTLPGDAPGGISNEDPMARPVSVAWTSARAQRCGFYFDPAKLKASYIAYETKQGAAGEQLARIERSYDTTFRGTSERVSGEADYCSDKKGAEIKADLQRYLAGDFTPNLPKPKPVASCGFFGCGSSTSDEPFNSKDFWKKHDADPKSRR